MTTNISNNQLNIRSELIIKNGYLVYEEYFNGWTQDDLSLLHSATKGITSVLAGIGIDKNYFSLNDKVLDFFPNRNFTNVDDRKKSITIENLLQMQSGIKWDQAVDPEPMKNSNDSIKFVLDRPMNYDPGTFYRYSAGDPQLLSAIITRVTNKSLLEFTEDNLFSKIGIGKDSTPSYKWDASPDGITIGTGNLYLIFKDFAKFGFLCLNNGSWDNMQVVSSDWISYSTWNKSNWQDLVDYKTDDYSFYWWIRKNLSFNYNAWGANGQYLTIFPDYDMIIVFTANDDTTATLNYHFDLIENFIVPAIYEIKTTTSSTGFSENFIIVLSIVALVIISNKRK